MNKRPQYNQQSKSEVEEICNMKYEIFAKTWKVAVTASIIKNKYPGGFHTRKNPKKQYLKEDTFSDPSFSTKHIYVYDHAA